MNIPLRARLATVTVGALAVAVVCAGAVSAQSLEQAMASAYRTNTQLLAQRASLRATDENVPQALSNWRPQVSVSGQIGVAADSQTSNGGFQGANSGSRVPRQAQLTVTQPVYRGGRTVAQTSQAENQVLAARAQLDAIEQSVFTDVVTAYANVLTNQAVLELNQSNVQVLTRQFEAARDRFQVGEVTRTDVAQSESRLARARADVIQAQGNLDVARTNFFRVVGEQPARLSAIRLPPNLPGTLDAAATTAATANPNVVAAQFNEVAAQDNVRLILGELLPAVSVQGQLTHGEDTQTRNVVRDTGQVVAQVTMPLYSSGSVESRVRQARQVANQRRIETENARRIAREQATQAFLALTTARARVRALLTQIRAQEIALDGVEQEARVGSRTVLDVLDAEQELLNAKVTLVQTQRDEVLANFQLASATGRLTARELRLPVDLYDPTQNYNQVRTRWFGFGINPGQ
ncbi:MAG: TolC family outer membrane protein [Alphaproteobacteria bacterium]|nr:TolC family outer membrane protein [Alphaproteobacteria bacterium]